MFGRRLWLPEINASNGMKRQGAERAAINAPMQGTAADLIKLAMIAVQSWLESEKLLMEPLANRLGEQTTLAKSLVMTGHPTGKLATRLIMQVHDELVLEVPDAELALVKEKLPQLMCDVAKLQVPLLVELGVGKNWDEAH